MESKPKKSFDDQQLSELLKGVEEDFADSSDDEDIKLAEESKRLREVIESESSAWYEISTEIIANMSDLTALLDKVLGIVRNRLDARGVHILYRKPDGEAIEKVTGTVVDEKDKGYSDTIVKDVIERGNPLTLAGTEILDKYSGVESIYVSKPKSFTCVPLKLENKSIGAIYADRSFSKKFTLKDQQFIEKLSLILSKAIRNTDLIENLILEKTRLQQQLEGKYNFSEIITQNEKMRKVFEILQHVIDSDVTVLIEGETGTGKELIAKAVHYNTEERKDNRFIAINCGALPENLLESELFGHVRGSFTGAHRDKKGLFEEADGGTLLLDEISEASPNIQVRLLRFLEEREIIRVGDTRPKVLNVRVICATNRNLAELVKSGTFRKDLYFRLNVVPIILPTLRERRDDIPLLVYHFVNRLSKEQKKNIKGVSQEAVQLMSSYTWEGNVRELVNTVARAVTLAPDHGMITPELLPDRIIQYGLIANISYDSSDSSLKRRMEWLEKKIIVEALEKYRWNKTHVADELKVSRDYLYKKMKEYNIDMKKR